MWLWPQLGWWKLAVPISSALLISPTQSLPAWEELWVISRHNCLSAQQHRDLSCLGLRTLNNDFPGPVFHYRLLLYLDLCHLDGLRSVSLMVHWTLDSFFPVSKYFIDIWLITYENLSEILPIIVQVNVKMVVY